MVVILLLSLFVDISTIKIRLVRASKEFYICTLLKSLEMSGKGLNTLISSIILLFIALVIIPFFSRPVSFKRIA